MINPSRKQPRGKYWKGLQSETEEKGIYKRVAPHIFTRWRLLFFETAVSKFIKEVLAMKTAKVYIEYAA